MPFVQITMIEGRTVEQKHALIRDVTDALVGSLGVRAESVRVALYEVTTEDWGIGGLPYSVARQPAVPDPSEAG